MAFEPNQIDERIKLLTQLTLSIVVLSVVLVLLVGLFEPKVDNDKIFAILGPAFSMIIGYFIGRDKK